MNVMATTAELSRLGLVDDDKQGWKYGVRAKHVS